MSKRKTKLQRLEQQANSLNPKNRRGRVRAAKQVRSIYNKQTNVINEAMEADMGYIGDRVPLVCYESGQRKIIGEADAILFEDGYQIITHLTDEGYRELFEAEVGTLKVNKVADTPLEVSYVPPYLAAEPKIIKLVEGGDNDEAINNLVNPRNDSDGATPKDAGMGEHGDGAPAAEAPEVLGDDAGDRKGDS